MKIACVIPARLLSTRFPKKVLAPLAGKPVLQHVWEAALQVPLFDSVSIAVDSEETAGVAHSFGGLCHMTSPHWESGTLRIAELVESGAVDADIIVGWQGDEPFIHAAMIEDLLQSPNDLTADVWTLKKRVKNLEDVLSPHITKVVSDAFGNALYFSRSPIPFYRDEKEEGAKVYYKHIGIYAYRKKTLLQAAKWPISPLQAAESLEQLAFLHRGLKVRVHETIHEVCGIDIPDHLAKAEEFLLQRGFQDTATTYS